MENKDYDRVAGSPQAPYFNKTLVPQGVLLQNSHAIGHPSEPNYLALFSGSTQGIHGDPCPVSFKAADVASELIAAGETFAGYSESMPHDGYKGCYQGLYDRNHNAWSSSKTFPHRIISSTTVFRRQSRPLSGSLSTCATIRTTAP
jgi:acid phosphatase